MLLEFLDKVAKEPANKMMAESVAMVMAPNLFLVSSGSRNRPQAVDRELQLAKATSKITLLLIANRSLLWMVNKICCSLSFAVEFSNLFQKIMLWITLVCFKDQIPYFLPIPQ